MPQSWDEKGNLIPAGTGSPASPTQSWDENGNLTGAPPSQEVKPYSFSDLFTSSDARAAAGQDIKNSAQFLHEHVIKHIMGGLQDAGDYTTSVWSEANNRAGATAGGSPVMELPGVLADQLLQMHANQGGRTYDAAQQVKQSPLSPSAWANYSKEAMGNAPGIGPPFRELSDLATKDPFRAVGQALGMYLGGKVTDFAGEKLASGLAQSQPNTPAAVSGVLSRDVDLAHKGTGDVLSSLKTPAGKGGVRAGKMTSDVGDIAQGDIASIFRDNPKATKTFGDAANAVHDYKENLWNTQYQPFIDAYHNQPTHGEALTSALGEFKPGIDNEADAAAARKWMANENLADPRTIATARAKLGSLNEQLAGQSPLNPYSPLQQRVMNATAQGYRDEIDNALIKDAGESSIRGVSQRYGALRNLEDRLRERAVAFPNAPSVPGAVAAAIHGYVFAHGLAIPAAGLGLNLGRFSRELNSPPSLLSRGLGRMSKSSLEAPEPLEAPSNFPGGATAGGRGYTTPGQTWGGPQGAAGPMPNPSPIKGLLPARTNGPYNAPGPGQWPIQLPAETPRPLTGPARQLPESTSPGNTLTPSEKTPAAVVPGHVWDNPGAIPARASSLEPKAQPPTAKQLALFSGSPPSEEVAPYLTGKHEFTIMSADNPHGEQLSPQENLTRHVQTINELRKLGYTPKDIEGVEEGRGGIHSVLVPGMSTDDALTFQNSMNRRYGYTKQQTVITKQGLVNTDTGKVNPIDFNRTAFGPAAERQPYHSIAQGGGERLPFALAVDGQKQVPIKTEFEGVHYSEHKLEPGEPLEAGRAGRTDPKFKGPAGQEANRLQKGGDPGVVWFYRKGTRGDPDIVTRRYSYVTKDDASLVAMEDSPEFRQARDQAVQQAKQSGSSDNDAHAIGVNAGLSAIKDAGYDGFYSKKFPNTVGKFGDQQVFRPGNEPQPPELSPHPNLPVPEPQTPPAGAASAQTPTKVPAKKAAAQPAKTPGSIAKPVGPGPAPVTAGGSLGLEPQPINPQEIADLQKQFPGRVIRAEDVSKLRREQAARANIQSGLAGNRGDEASMIREQNRATLEKKSSKPKQKKA